MYHVYVLNNSYECVSRTTFVRALTLVTAGSAEVVKWSDKVVHTTKETLQVPLMIRIFKYVRAFGRALKYSKRFVWERDDYTCQYCGKNIETKNDLETDHVIPESRGGKETYKNMVTACRSCNPLGKLALWAGSGYWTHGWFYHGDFSHIFLLFKLVLQPKTVYLV